VLDLDGDKGLTTANVNRLYDATPNAHTATQDTSGSRPSLVENDSDFNGHNSLSFDGVSDFLTAPDSADFELGTGLTIYIVAKVPNAGSNNTLMAKRATIGTDMSWRIQVVNNVELRWVIRNAANTGSYTAIGPTHLNDTGQVVKVRHAAGVDSAIRVDSDSETVVAAPDEVASSVGTLNIFSLNTAGTHYMPGKCARILIYKESIPDGSTADLAIMAELDALYKGMGSSIGLDFSTEGNLVADFNPDTGAGLATTAWADQSGGTAHDAAQATTTKQPSYMASDASFNGHGSVAFDGVDDWLSISDHADLAATGGLTVYIVGSVPITGVTQAIFGNNSGGASNREWAMRALTTGTFQALIRNSADTAWQTASATAVAGTPSVFRMRYDATDVRARIDTTEGTAAATTERDVGSDTAIGANVGGSFSATLTTPHILTYSRAVTAAEDARIMAYLNARYGI